jgi:AbrB family looped-hinge helix DNA binding protein
MNIKRIDFWGCILAIDMIFCQKRGGKMETSLDRFGRIVIPKRIREDFNLKAGTPIRIEEGDQTIILTPVHGEPHLHVKDGVLVYTGIPLEDLSDTLSRHREERMKSVRK